MPGNEAMPDPATILPYNYRDLTDAQQRFMPHSLLGG